MKWSNIDWRRGTYSVRENLTRRRRGVQGGFSAPKTEDSAATVDLSVECRQALKDHQADHAQQKLKMGAAYEDYDLIFATDHGRPLDHKNLGGRWFHADLAAAGLRRIRFHDLRHTCATRRFRRPWIATATCCPSMGPPQCPVSTNACSVSGRELRDLTLV